jgi:hypothetical protein
LRLNVLDVLVVDFFADDFEEPVKFRFLARHRADFGEADLLDFLNNLLIARVGDLSAVGPISLIAVVLRRVVACGDNDARRRAEAAKPLYRRRKA